MKAIKTIMVYGCETPHMALILPVLNRFSSLGLELGEVVHACESPSALGVNQHPVEAMN